MAETSLVARRVGDNEKPPVRVDGDRGLHGADTHTREHERCRRAQAKSDRGRDRESDPAQRRRIYDDGGYDPGNDKDGGDRPQR